MSSGPQITLENLRLASFKKEPSERGVIYACGPQSTGFDGDARIDLDGESKVARLLNKDTDEYDNLQLNLMPGEQNSLEIYFTGEKNSYSGQLVIDAKFGDELTTLKVPTRSGNSIDRPGVGSARGLTVTSGETASAAKPFVCTTRGLSTPCSGAELRRQLKRLYGAG